MKKLILSLSIILLLTGCSSVSTNMEIKDDKSMNLSIDILFEEETRNLLKDFLNTKKDEFEQRGFSIKEKASGFYGGYNVSKEYESIDDITYSGNNKVIISKIIYKDFDDNKIFSLKKGLFYNTYSAYFEFEALDDLYMDNKDLTKKTTIDDNGEEVEEEEIDYTKDVESSIYRFSVTLPDKPIISNATTKTNEGKTLSWNLSYTENTEINFSFKMKNTLNIILIIVLGILIIGVVGFILIKKIISKSKIEKNKPIYRGYDESIKDEIENTSNIGKVASAVTNDRVVEEPKEEPVKEEVIEETFIIEEPKPEIATVESNIQILNDYQMKIQEEEMVRKVARENANPKPKDPLFVNSFNQRVVQAPIKEEKKKIEIDIPDIEEMK